MMRLKSQRRGSIGVLGMVAMAFVLAMLTATVLLRSLDAYKASADLESRLQARAAAEGAVVVLLHAQAKPPEAPLEIGKARVHFEPLAADAATSGATTARFRVEVMRGSGRAILSQAYSAKISCDTASAQKPWCLEKLEVVR